MTNRVAITNNEYRATYKVYFCQSSGQERNAALLKGCRLIDNESSADVKVFITEQEYKADIKITRDHFPKR